MKVIGLDLNNCGKIIIKILNVKMVEINKSWNYLCRTITCC